MNDGVYETEVISVDGEEHEVLKRNDHTIGNDIAAASLLVSIMMRNAIQDFTCFANKLSALEQKKAFLCRCCNQFGSSLPLPSVAVTNSLFLISIHHIRTAITHVVA